MPRGHKSKQRSREKRLQSQQQLAQLDLQQTLNADEAAGYMRREGANYFGEYRTSPHEILYPPRDNRSPLDEKVVLMVYYLLYKYQRKELVTKSEMLKNIIQTSRSHFSEILSKAAEHLELVFGLDMKETEPNKHIYILVNKLDFSYDQDDGRNLPKTGLLLTILGVIFIKGNRATEEQIWEVLNMLGIYKGRRHFIFGEPKRLITKDLVKEKYLRYCQIPYCVPPRYEFLWGPRAYVETSKMKVLEYLAKVHQTVPSTFPVWYEEALRDEEERAKVRAEAKARIALARARERSRALAFATRT